MTQDKRPYRLVVVTATTDAIRFGTFSRQLHMRAQARVPVVCVQQKSRAWIQLQAGLVDKHEDYLGVVPAFARGVDLALRAYPQAEVIACLHDDVLLHEQDWDRKLLEHFDTHPQCGLAGFGGAWGLGDEQAGQGAYRPTWLVRRGFMSNMADAEVHGSRMLTARPVAVLDGFSQVFRANFLAGQPAPGFAPVYLPDLHSRGITLFGLLQQWGVMHHAYDAATGAFAKQLGWETWYLPFACQHLGGQTAVGDAGYAEWAKVQRPDPGTNHPHGDQAFWTEAHQIIWQRLGHLLPFEAGGRL